MTNYSSQQPAKSKVSKPNESGLQFKPITQGLGFHPFSEGLPYSESESETEFQESKTFVETKLPTRPLPPRPASFNVSKAATHASAAAKGQKPGTASAQNSQMGEGAEAAGQPFYFVPPKQRLQKTGLTSAQTTAPVFLTTPAAEKNLNDLFGISRPQPQQQVSTNFSVQPPVFKKIIPDQTFGFDYLMKRVMAYGVDSVLNIGICGTALLFVMWKQKLNLNDIGSLDRLALLALLAFVVFFSWALITAQEILFGTTAGKRMFGLGIFGTPSTIFIRSLFFMMGLALGGLGVIWSIFQPERRGWHDIVADLQPEDVATL